MTDEWQPISTVPRDGRDVLLWWRDKKISVSRPHNAQFLVVLMEAGATHWRPLPPPPKDAKR